MAKSGCIAVSGVDVSWFTRKKLMDMLVKKCERANSQKERDCVIRRSCDLHEGRLRAQHLDILLGESIPREKFRGWATTERSKS